MAAAPPQVSYQNGQLTIQSQNSTLGDILAAVRRQTGAQIEVPPGANAQRIATRLGPASPRDVVTSLLNASGFDYVILGSNQAPGSVERVILTGKHAVSSQPAPNVAQGAPQQPAPGPTPAEVAPEGEEEMEQQPVVEEQPQPEEQQPPPQEGQQPGLGQQQPQQPQANPGGAPAQFPAQPQSSEQQNPNQPQVKTPDQLLQELQRMQQQQQQQERQQKEQAPPQDQQPQ